MAKWEGEPPRIDWSKEKRQPDESMNDYLERVLGAHDQLLSDEPLFTYIYRCLICGAGRDSEEDIQRHVEVFHPEAAESMK